MGDYSCTFWSCLSEDIKFIHASGLNWRVYESGPKSDSNLVIVFFHGFSFSIDDWVRIGTLGLLKESGFRVVAIDLPRGRASKTDKLELKHVSDYNPMIHELLNALEISKEDKIVLVGASMGGGFALSFALDHPKKVAGLVLIAPSIREISEDSIKALEQDIPVLLVWGDRDDVFPLEQYAKSMQKLIPHSKLVILKDASHPAYLDKTEEFNQAIFDFLK